jgi:DNA-directed RNA polymerase alpha subunit
VTGFEIDAKSRSEVEGPVVVEVYLEEVEGLPKRVVSILAENGIDTVNEVVNTSKEALLSLKGLGEKSLDEFMAALMDKVEVKVEVIEEVVEVDNSDEEKA